MVLSLLSDPVSDAITSNWGHVRATLLGEVTSPLQSEDFWKWALLGAVLFAAVRATKVAESVSKRTSRVMLYAIGLTAPLAAFGVYLLLLVLFARSPYVHLQHEPELDRAAAAVPPVLVVE